MRSHVRRILGTADGRHDETLPCPCCGHHTLHEGPGLYELCPVCFWEDADDQLRWPSLADGPNGISLLEAQRNFAAIGACDAESVRKVRAPRPGEEREPGWRPITPERDDIESGPDDPRNLPWPADPTELYWWRPTYFRRPENRRPGPAPRRPPADAAERLMARILDVVPETEEIDVELRSRWEEPQPFEFCGELASFVVAAVDRHEADRALVVVGELESGLTAGGDDEAITCVSFGFFEPFVERYEERRDSEELQRFVAAWPPAMRSELRRRTAHYGWRARMRGDDDEELERKRCRMPEGSDGTMRVPLWWRLRHLGRWRRIKRDGGFDVGE